MKIKKLLSVILVNFILMVFFSANLSAYAEYNYTCDYMYNIFETKDERNFYNALYKNCEKVDNNTENYEYTPFTSYGNLSFEKAQEIAFIFSQDHPEYFWLSSQTLYSTDSKVAAFVLLDDFQNGRTRQSTKKSIESAAQKYIDGAMNYSTDFEKVQYIYNKLKTNVKYEFGDWDQTIASVFLQKNTVCAGYSKAFELLCNAVGIDTIILTSCVHAWNAVKIDNRWYLIDVTNNDSQNTYFLISDSKMAEIDRTSGTKYKITETTKQGDKVYEFYMHDIDYLTYIDYYDDFPECSINYSDLGSSSAFIVGALGDANLNGVVNIRDAAYIAKMIAKGLGAELPQCTDFNKDGVVNIRDAAALAKYLASASI